MVDREEPPMARPSEDQALPNSSMQDAVIIDLKAMLPDRKEPPLSTSRCIYRVPCVIREQNAEAYTPKVVSIGPFHYGNPRLQNLETHKQIYFKQFIDRTKSATILDGLVRFVRNSERRIRTCYSENIELSKEDLVKVILVDAIFIIELFMMILFLKEDRDDIVGNPWMVGNIKMDLLLLENQLPFFILEELYDLALPSETCDEFPSFRKLTFHFFSDFNRNHWRDDSNVSIKHFTDLLRTFYFDPNKEESDREELGNIRLNQLVYRARELNNAGVKLKKANERKSLINLKFSRNILEIPEILVEYGTEILLRNMIALEQYRYPYEAYITYYVYVLASLIKKSEDVNVLVHNRIIVNYLDNSNVVVQLFNGLCKDLAVPNFSSDYLEICAKLKAFYEGPWNNWKASLRNDYCRTPWQSVASVAGIVVVVLTIVQTICSIIAIV